MRLPTDRLSGLRSTLATWLRLCVRWFDRAEARPFLIVIGIGLAYGSYFALRYGGYWAENDTHQFALAVQRLIDNGTLIYNDAYQHGYAYSLWAAMLSLVTGLEVGTLLRIVTPVIGNALLAVMGFAAFRRFLRSDRLALIATGTLFLVPELVFTASRGNHEKLAIALTLLVSLALLHGFQEMFGQRRWSVYIAWAIVYHLAAFALLTVNIIFSSAVIFAWTFAFMFARAVSWITRDRVRRETLRIATTRLAVVTGTAWFIAFIVVWYVYPPTQNDLGHIQDAVERLSSFALERTSTSDPYAILTRDWISPAAYNTITVFRWVLLTVSGLTAVVLLGRLLLRPSTLALERLLLLGLFIAFGLELAIGVVVDFVGLDLGDNLQVRFFTYFGLVACAIFAIGIDAALSFLRRFVPARVLRVALSVALTFFVVTSLIKATLDPIVSNNWILYHPLELVAMQAWAEHEVNRTLYIGPEIRLWYAWTLSRKGDLPRENRTEAGRYDNLAAHSILSRLKTEQMRATERSHLDIIIGNRVYDNGEAQIYHRPSGTPFQP